MNINDAFPSKYVQASDLNNQECQATIADVRREEVGDDRDLLPVVYFQGRAKGLVLNKTNAFAIAEQYGLSLIHI